MGGRREEGERRERGRGEEGERKGRGGRERGGREREREGGRHTLLSLLLIHIG